MRLVRIVYIVVVVFIYILQIVQLYSCLKIRFNFTLESCICASSSQRNCIRWLIDSVKHWLKNHWTFYDSENNFFFLLIYMYTQTEIHIALQKIKIKEKKYVSIPYSIWDHCDAFHFVLFFFHCAHDLCMFEIELRSKIASIHIFHLQLSINYIYF